MSTLQRHYKMATDWDGTFYCGITLRGIMKKDTSIFQCQITSPKILYNTIIAHVQNDKIVHLSRHQ